jgi:hypothetical protein
MTVRTTHVAILASAVVAPVASWTGHGLHRQVRTACVNRHVV